MVDEFKRFGEEVHAVSHQMTKVIARSRDLLDRTKNLPGMKTPAERAADAADRSGKRLRRTAGTTDTLRDGHLEGCPLSGC